MEPKLGDPLVLSCGRGLARMQRPFVRCAICRGRAEDDGAALFRRDLNS